MLQGIMLALGFLLVGICLYYFQQEHGPDKEENEVEH